MEMATSEFELTYLMTTPYYIINRDVFLATGKQTWFYEATRFINRGHKIVSRLHNDKTMETYQKDLKTMTNKHGKVVQVHRKTNLQLFVFKESIETPTKDIIVEDKIFICERISWPHPSDPTIKYEATMKIPTGLNGKVTDPKVPPQEKFNSLFSDAILPQNVVTNVAVEFSESPDYMTLDKIRLEMMNNYGIDFSMVAHNINQIVSYNKIANLVSKIQINKPRAIGITEWRKMLPKTGEIYKSHKPDGFNGIAILSKRHGLLIYSQGMIYLSTGSGDSLNEEVVMYREANREVHNIIKNADFVAHGEMMPKMFVMFGAMSLASDAHPDWSQAVQMDEVKRLMATLCHKYKIVTKKYVPLGVELPRVEYDTDGFIVSKDDGSKYTEIQLFKVKPPEHNTIDVRLRRGRDGHYFATCVFMRYVKDEVIVRSPLFLSGQPNLAMSVIPYEPGYVEGAIYECNVTPQGMILPQSVRLDKRNANSISAIMDTFACFQLPPWFETIKNNGNLGFYNKSSYTKNDNRRMISQQIHGLIGRMMKTTKARRVVDIGGGKMGYIGTLLSYVGQLELYLNLEISLFDIYDAIGRICRKNEDDNSNTLHAKMELFNKLHCLDGPMQTRATLESVPKEWLGTFDLVMSIFAFHHGCGSEEEMSNTLNLLGALAAPKCNVMIVVYDFDKIRNELTNKKELDLGIVRFQPHDDWHLQTALSFQNYKYFIESAPSIVRLCDEISKRGFMMTGTIEFNDSMVRPLKYIKVLKFSKIA